MSLGPEVLPLTTWVENNISAIYKASTSDAFNEAFNAFLHEDAQIYVNGNCLTRHEYKRQLQNQKLGEYCASVTFSNAVQVPVDTVGLTETGSVGVFYKVTLFDGALVHDSHIANIVTSSLNAIVTNKPEAGTKASILTEIWATERAL
ncbi:hypothetical protein DAEQUDRAFT_693415 [Daedalea quercina L-15889]|uniref:SnoaL-like domain-containing protein n=1 Tax=Daedalea quercina L-15889 TaxID=1314783 RepID=A0A165P7I9_9APHY|nr:hypothetical protein DAEQUDRAFT_693415 [Daedalea quercina L-15889]